MRTMIPSIVNCRVLAADINSFILIILKIHHHLVAEFSSLIFDYVTRQKIGGTHLNQLYLKQLPLLDTTKISAAEDAALLKAVLEPTYTSNILRHWAEDLGHYGSPFVFDRRAFCVQNLMHSLQKNMV